MQLDGPLVFACAVLTQKKLLAASGRRAPLDEEVQLIAAVVVMRGERANGGLV